MRILRQRKQNRVDRRMALEGVPTMRPGVRLEHAKDGSVRVTMTLRRGSGFFERLRPPETRRSYDLDEFGAFVVGLLDGQRTVLDVVNAFEKRFRMSRREVELSVVAFVKLLMQRNVLAVVVPKTASSGAVRARAALVAVALCTYGLCGSGAMRADVLAGEGLPVVAEEQADVGETPAAAATMRAIREICEIGGVRMPGSPGNLALEAWVDQHFQASGFEAGNIRFGAPVFEPGMLTLDCGEAGTFELEAMHAALMRPGNFATNDFGTRLVYLGKGGIGDLDRLRGVDLAGAIAVMDYNCGDAWLDLLRFEIEGVVFVGEAPYLHRQSVEKLYASEVAVPRFFIDGEAGERLRRLAADNPGLAVEAHAVPSTWRHGELRNLWVLIPGADEVLSEKVIVLTASLDANSVVPGRAYGAQRTVNLHILMKLLEDFKQTRPLYSVMLVALNGHTQRYAGERQLAWHLMADETDVEALRDEMASEMRLARLHTTEYGKLHLEPVSEEDKPDLHTMMEILWQLDHVQSATRGQAHKEALEKHSQRIAEARANGEAVDEQAEMQLPELDEVLDLSVFTEQDVRAAIDRAEEELRKAYGSFFAKQGRVPEEVDREEQEDLGMIQAIRAMPFEAFMEKARRVKHAFDDEKLFEKWRATMDTSTGQRIYVKTRLQDEFRSQVNRLGQDILVTSSPARTTMPDEERQRRLAELEERRDNLRRVLVLFNKMDIGIGRSRTYYRQIAVNDRQRGMLKEAVDHFIDHYGRWQTLHDATLERDARAGTIRTALGRRRVALALSLEMDAHGDRVGFSYQSPRVVPGWFSGFAAICKELAAGLEPEGAELDGAEEASTGPYVDALSGQAGTTAGYYFNKRQSVPSLNRSYIPESGIWYYHAANRTPAFALKSAFTDAGHTFGPDDTVGHLDPERVHALETWTRQFLGAMVAHPEIVAPANLSQPNMRWTMWSTLLRTYGLEEFSGKPTPTQPIPDCVLALYQSTRNYDDLVPPIIDGDVVNCYMAMTDDTASTYIYGIAEMRRLASTAYQMDEDFREVVYTVDKGRVQKSKQISSTINRSLRATLPMFPCREFVIKDSRDPTMIAAKPIMVQRIWPKVAKGQSDPEKYGVHGAASLSPAAYHLSSGPIGVYLYRRRPELEQDRLMVITESRRCLLNATEENPKGEGFLDQSEMGGDMIRRASADMAILNKSRNAGMQGVVNQLLDEFLERGDRLNREAEEKKAAHDHVGYLRTIYEAFGNQVKAYDELQKMNADMLKAVIVYMALMLPFCFFLQKLIFNFKRLEHELAGFAGLFFATFLLFRFIHPAFRLAMSPEAIFIAFVLGAIGVFTTGVLRARFNEEMSLLFRGMGGIGEEVGYGTVGTTAMLIGVQNMRRRRVRTSLTMATIVLVVFSMLAFSSVSRTAKPTLIPRGASAPYTGLFYHWPAGAAMDEGTHRAIRELFADRADVRVRRLLSSPDAWQLERTDDPATFLSIEAVTGLPLNDGVLRDSMALVEGEQFSSLYAEEILLTVAAADALGFSAADVGRAKVRLLDREWLLKGLIDDQRYRLARDLNPNLPLVPFAKLPKSEKGDDTLDAEVANITEALMDTSHLVIIPEGTASALGALPRSISVVFTNVTDELQLGMDLRRVLDVTAAKFYVGSRRPFKLDDEAAVPVKAGVYYVGSSYRTAIGGVAKLLIPLIIAGSIILNTMLGTVYERKSEIAVFNAIGLNPTHIFMFFLAEAVVYSFIGAIGGYLIGQILTIALKAAGLIQNVNINFSSLMVVYAILFTMALVILSTLYPGYVATRTAVPSGKRKWSLPDHDGQHMSIVFPFIYRAHLAYGVMYYIQQFFAPMSDQSLGEIVASLEDIRESKDVAGHPILSLRYTMALSPFDLGVTQSVTFITRYDEPVKSFRLHMEVDRISGRDTNWITTNTPFLERMRKFLIRWRNIDPTRQTWFVRHAIEMFKSGVPPEATGNKE